MLHRDYSKVKHVAAVQAAAREYRETFKAGHFGPLLKAAETKLNLAVEAALEPH
jgi:hypothetical protein